MSDWKPHVDARVTLTNLRRGEVLHGRIDSVEAGRVTVVTDDGRRWGPIDPPYSFLRPEAENPQRADADGDLVESERNQDMEDDGA